MAQTWKLKTSYYLKSPARLTSIDRFDNILINDDAGNIYKLDSQARLLAEYASSDYGLLSSIEAWSSLRVFLFYQDTQRYTYLDRFLSSNEFSEFPNEHFGFILLASPSSDNQMWLLDQSQLTLIKFDIKFNSITVSQNLGLLSDSLDLSPHRLLEYQNRVYLGDEKAGVLVFDNMGNYLHTIDKLGNEPFHFRDEQLYYLHNNKLHIRSIYKNQHNEIELPDTDLVYQQVLMLSNSMVFISGQSVHIYAYNPR